MKKIILGIILMLFISINVKSQTSGGVSVNGDTISSGWTTVYYCSGALVNISYWGCDSIELRYGESSTFIIHTSPTLIDPSFFSNNFTLDCFGPIDSADAVTLQPKTTSLSITTLSNYVNCGQPFDLTLEGVGDTISSVNWIYGTNSSTNNPFSSPPLSSDIEQYYVTAQLTNGCSTKDSITMYRTPVPAQIITASDFIGCGKPVNLTLSVTGDTISSINWVYGTNSSTNNPLNAPPFSGSSEEYVATAILTSGCTTKDSIVLNRQALTGNVCWATVDTASQHNIVVWDTTGTYTEGIDSLRLYFYNASNNWQLISEEPYTDTINYFVDTINNPNANTVRYSIISVDSCGDEEPFSSSIWQNTMHITNTSGTFSWGLGYLIEGVSQPVLTYYLYKNNVAIDSVSGTQTSMTDPNYSLTANYYVAAKLNIDMCALSPLAFSKRPESGSGSSLTHSNVVNSHATGIETLTNTVSATVYPNPTNGMFNLTLTNFESLKNKNIEIVNVLGETVYSSVITGKNSTFSLDLPNGIYFLQIKTDNGIENQKLIISK